MIVRVTLGRVKVNPERLYFELLQVYSRKNAPLEIVLMASLFVQHFQKYSG